jgi:uncharacterized membrane protein
MGVCPLSKETRHSFLGAILLVLIVFGQLLLAGGLVAAARPFWFDELVTHTLVTDSDTLHSFRALADGIEQNPPTLHLFLRAYTAVWPEVDEFCLRSFSLLSAVAGLVAIYLILHVRHGRMVGVVTALGLWAQPLILHQALEARFYAPWLAAIAWFAYFLRRALQAPTGWNRVALCLSSAVVCTIHYFGVLSFATVAVGTALTNRESLRNRRGVWLAAMSGPLALAACVPLYLSQRNGLDSTWWGTLSPLTQTLELLTAVTPGKQIVLAVVVPWLLLTIAGIRRGEESSRDGERVACDLPISGLVFIPSFLLLISLLVAPVLVARYGIVTVVGFAPLLASLLSGNSRRAVALVGLSFVFLGTVGVAGFASDLKAVVAARETFTADIEKDWPGVPLVFEDIVDFLPMYKYDETLRPRISCLKFTEEEVSDAGPHMTCQRLVFQQWDRHYGPFPSMWLSDLRNHEKILLFPAQRGVPAADTYGGFQIRRVSEHLYLLTREEA